MSFIDDSKIPRCCDCRYADYYPIQYMYGYCDPYCSITKKSISADDIGCEFFELIGRLSR